MKIHNDIVQGSEEWLALRLGKFTASNAQAIANNGRGLETLVYEKVAEKITGKAKDQYTNADMDRGNELEEMARNSYELETGILVKKVGFVELSEWVGASPDGTIDEDGLQEIKCKNDAHFVRFMYTKKIDPEHMWQMQMQMHVTERKWVDYVLFNPNFAKSLLVTRVQRDEEAIKELIVGLKKAEDMAKEIIKNI